MSLRTHNHEWSNDHQAAARRHNATGPEISVTWFLIGLVACTALTGLVAEDLYTGAESTAQMLRGFDLVTALVVLPALGTAALRARHGSMLARLIVAALIGYVVYTYAYHLFGTGFNDLFLLHAAVFSTGLVALGLNLVSLDLTALADRFDPHTKVRTIAGILGVLGTALGAMWVYAGVDNAVTGDLPAGSRLVETDTVVHLGMALDLTLLVPLYAVAALLLWRRAPWGYVLAGLALLPGVLHQLSYLVAMPFQVVADVPGSVAFDRGEPFIVLLYLTGALLLLQGARHRREAGNQ